MCLFAAVICLLNVAMRLQTIEQIFKTCESGRWEFELIGLNSRRCPKPGEFLNVKRYCNAER